MRGLSSTIRMLLTTLLIAILGCLAACGEDICLTSYPNSIWVCEEPRICITVNSQGDALGKMAIGGKDVNFLVGIGKGGWDEYIVAYSLVDGNYFDGEINFEQEGFTITLDGDWIWEGQYDRLLFQRQE